MGAQVEQPLQEQQQQQQHGHLPVTAPPHQAVIEQPPALRDPADDEGARPPPRRGCRAVFCGVVCSPSGWQQKVLCVVWWAAVIAACIAVFAVLIPKALAGPIQRLIAFLSSRLSVPQITGICFAAVVLLPFTIILPMQPFIWVAGLALPFWTAYGVVMAASAVGMSAQYWTARLLFKERAERYLLRNRRDGVSVSLRAVEMAGPWKVVALVRLGPSPFALCNYLFGACPTIKFHQYIVASTLCIAHHRALSVFFGRAMPTLADLFSGKPVQDVGTAVYRIIVLVLGILLCVGIVIWAKRALKKLQAQELEREAAAAAAAEAGDAEQGGAPAGAGSSAAATGAAGQQLAPLDVEGKLAAAAGGKGKGAASDLDMIVVDASASSPASLAADSTLSLGRTSAGSGLIAAGQLPPAAAADSDSRASLGGRLSSVSSLRGLLSGRWQRSS